MSDRTKQKRPASQRTLRRKIAALEAHVKRFKRVIDVLSKRYASARFALAAYESTP